MRRWLRGSAVRQRRVAANGWNRLAHYIEDLVFVTRQRDRALRKFLAAPDEITACRVLVLHPILVLESASERLMRTIASAEARGDAKNKEMLERHLRIMRLVREKGLKAMMQGLRPERE